MPMPILSVEASIISKLASESPSTLKSISAPDSLKTNVPPSKLTLPVAVNAVVASVVPSYVRLLSEVNALVPLPVKS